MFLICDKFCDELEAQNFSYTKKYVYWQREQEFISRPIRSKIPDSTQTNNNGWTGDDDHAIIGMIMKCTVLYVTTIIEEIIVILVVVDTHGTQLSRFHYCIIF